MGAEHVPVTLGSSGSPTTQQLSPDGLTGSPMPPMGEMIASEMRSRGPGVSPSSIARLNVVPWK